MIERAEALVPRIQALASQAEAERTMPPSW